MIELKSKNFKCPHCKAKLTTFIPTPKLVSSKGYWDSLVICDKCHKALFKKVFPSGKIQTIKIN